MNSAQSVVDPPVQQTGTLHEFIAARMPTLPNEEAMEAFGKEIYNSVMQIVLGNEDWFTAESVGSLPRLTKFNLPKIFKWIIQFDLWFDGLNEFEQIALHNAEFIWE